MRRNFCAAGERFFSYSGAIFERPRSLFIDYSGAKYTRFPRKSPLLKEHFFEWLKTAISSNACGTSTLKSLLPQAFAVSNVHPRPQKRLARCTLDCGFKIPESPALRGFEAGSWALATAALYLVLKSNGPHRSKNPPVKFGFSPKTVPANIAKKLPSQRCFKPLFIASFNFSHKRRNVRFKGLRRVHTPPHPRIVHTAAYTPKQGLFRMGVVSLLSERSARSPTSPGRVSERQVLPLLGLGRGCSQRMQKAFGTAMRLCASLFRGVAAPLGCVICLQLGDVAVFSLCAQYFLNVRGGGGITTLGAFHTVRKPCVAGV